SEETMDNLSMIAKDLIEKQANGALLQGVLLHLSQSPAQPATFYKLQLKLLDNGVYLAADLAVTPTLNRTHPHSERCDPF
ncbi:hypothetical protein PMAYCL1PPCAC_17234, partial [Pristionchus mayeri]